MSKFNRQQNEWTCWKSWWTWGFNWVAKWISYLIWWRSFSRGVAQHANEDKNEENYENIKDNLEKNEIKTGVQNEDRQYSKKREERPQVSEIVPQCKPVGFDPRQANSEYRLPRSYRKV